MTPLKPGDKGQITLRFEVLDSGYVRIRFSKDQSALLFADQLPAAQIVLDPVEWKAGDRCTWNGYQWTVVAIKGERVWAACPGDDRFLKLSDLRRPDHG